MTLAAVPTSADIAVRTAVVMDDQPEVCSIIVSQLQRLGVAARGVSSEAELVGALDRGHPELVLLDLSLGDTDAIEMFVLLREANFRGQAVLMSGHPVPVLNHARRIGERVGVDIISVLRKPFRLDDLKVAISALPDDDGAARATRSKAPPAKGLLRAALEQDWLEFWYQAKLDLRTGLVDGAECLARIRHPVHGVFSPGAFLDTAGDDELDQLLVRGVTDSLACAGEAARKGMALDFCVNVPGRIIIRPDLLNELRALRERIFPEATLTLELTETDLVEDQAAAAIFATRALLHGFGLSIDDFGNGYATFERLRNVPFNELKLDRSVIHGCAQDTAKRNICRAAVILAHDFGATAVAEGVERKDDLDMVHQLGFDTVQGFLLARPMPFDELARFLELGIPAQVQQASVGP